MTSGAHHLEPKVCKDCRRLYYSWGAHAEECVGPRQRIAPLPPEPVSCDCPPGAWHNEGCYLLTEGERA